MWTNNSIWNCVKFLQVGIQVKSILVFAIIKIHLLLQDIFIENDNFKKWKILFLSHQKTFISYDSNPCNANYFLFQILVSEISGILDYIVIILIHILVIFLVLIVTYSKQLIQQILRTINQIEEKANDRNHVWIICFGKGHNREILRQNRRENTIW